MLPVYKAIQYNGKYTKKNRNNPWLITVDTGAELKSYVVKLFSTKSIENHDCVAKEVLGNLIAKEFDLPVPKAALIDMGNEFVSTLRSFQLIDELDSKDYRLKFGTEEQKGVVPFQVNYFSGHEAKQIIDIDTTFAFDCLIRNIDRNRANPNLLVRSDEAFLIDHELAFQIDEKSTDEIINRWFLQEKFFRNHLFYNYLKRSNRTTKNEYFTTFEDYLRMLNINTLNKCLEQLSAYGFSKKSHTLMLSFIQKMKDNSSIFVKILKGIIDDRTVHI